MGVLQPSQSSPLPALRAARGWSHRPAAVKKARASVPRRWTTGPIP